MRYVMLYIPWCSPWCLRVYGNVGRLQAFGSRVNSGSKQRGPAEGRFGKSRDVSGEGSQSFSNGCLYCACCIISVKV